MTTRAIPTAKADITYGTGEGRIVATLISLATGTNYTVDDALAASWAG
jgi:hypothetical protein